MHRMVLGTKTNMDVAEFYRLLHKSAPRLRHTPLTPQFLISAVLHVHSKHLIVILRAGRVKHDLNLLGAACRHNILQRVRDEDVRAGVLPPEPGSGVARVGDLQHLLDTHVHGLLVKVEFQHFFREFEGDGLSCRSH